MALGRETIGTAYVRILADGSGLDESVKRQMRDAGPVMHAAGREGAQEWTEGAQKEFEKGASRAKLRQGIITALNKNQAIEKYLSSPKWEETKKRLRTQFKEAGEVAGADMARGLIETGDFEAFNHRIQNILPEIARATRKIQSEEDAFARKFRADLDKITADSTRLLRETKTEFVNFHHTTTEVFDDIHAGHVRMARDWEGMRKDIDKIRSEGEPFVKLRRDIDEFGDSVARAFGKGSRNNFINFFGALVGNIARIPGTFLGFVGKFVTGFQRLAAAAEENGGWVRGLTVTIGELAPKLAAGSVAIGGFIFALGALTSAVSLAAGVVAALASSIAFGLVGALAPLVGLLGPIALAIGAVATAFIGMNDAGKKATKETLKPLTDLLKDLGDAVRPGILSGLTDAFDALGKQKGLLGDVTELAKTAGDAIGGFIREFGKAATGKGTRDFIRMMTETLPSTLEALGRSFGNVLDAIGSVFTVLNRPGGPVERFVNWLDTITSDFSTWAASAEGRNSIADFFDKAWASAKQLGEFLGAVWDLLSQIISAGRAPGDQMFGGITDTIQGWADAIRANPDILKDWFDSAREFGAAVGGAAIAIGELFDALDTASTRTAAITFFRVFGDAVEVAANFLSLFDSKLVSVGLTIAGAVIAWPAITKTLTGIGGYFSAFGGKVEEGASKMTRFTGAAKNLAGPAGLGLLISSTGETNRGLSLLEGAAGGALTGFAVGGPWGAGIGAVAGGLLSVATNAMKSKSGLEQSAEAAKKAVEGFGDLKTTLDQVTGAYTEASRAMVFQKAEQSGLIQAMAEFGINGDTVIDAMLGQRDAAAQVQSVMDDLQASVRGNTEAAKDLRQQAAQSRFGAASGALNKEAEAHENAAAKAQQQLDTLKDLRGQVVGSVRDVRKASQAVGDWDEKLRGLPPEVITRFQTNIPKTDKQVAELLKKYGAYDKKDITTTFKAFDLDITDKKLEGLIKDIQEYGKQHPMPKIDADTAPWTKAAQGVRSSMQQLDGQSATLSLKADTSQYTQAMIEAEIRRQQLDGSTATVTVFTKRASGGRTQLAAGGIVAGAHRLLVGEAGPEAVVPLNRPLAMVDPAVRELSAIAQGLTTPRMGSGGVVVPQKVTNVGGINIITPTTDPAAVAQETINRLVAVGY
jgi:hypothetical protein